MPLLASVTVPTGNRSRHSREAQKTATNKDCHLLLTAGRNGCGCIFCHAFHFCCCCQMYRQLLHLAAATSGCHRHICGHCLLAENTADTSCLQESLPPRLTWRVAEHQELGFAAVLRVLMLPDRLLCLQAVAAARSQVEILQKFAGIPTISCCLTQQRSATTLHALR
jgi:hypothetical protein